MLGIFFQSINQPDKVSLVPDIGTHLIDFIGFSFTDDGLMDAFGN